MELRFLLDTHAFLWLVSGDPKLSSRAISTFELGDVFLSTASVWEIVTKHQIGRLSLPSPPSEFIPQQLERNRIPVLPILPRHALRLETLPLHHRDPFDRILVAQAVEERLTILTADPQLARYGAATTW